MKQLIACCGLDCENCAARIATVNNDDELREKTAKEWSVLNNTPEITPETIHCMGCRADGVKFAYAAIIVLSANVCTKKVSILAATVRNWILARW